MSLLEGIRLFFGALFILLLPGFAWSFVLFAKRGIDWLERMAISVCLSIAIVPATVFWLHWLLDVSISLLTVSLVATALTIVPVGYLAFQRRSSCRQLLTRLRNLRRATRPPPPDLADTQP